MNLCRASILWPLLVVLVCGALLAGCGQRGDLYLPGDSQQDQVMQDET